MRMATPAAFLALDGCPAPSSFDVLQEHVHTAVDLIAELMKSMAVKHTGSDAVHMLLLSD